MLIENGKMLPKNEEVAKEFNQYFGHIIDFLDLYEFLDEKVCELPDDADNKVFKFRNHTSIVKIKEQYKVRRNFTCRLVTRVHKKDDPTDKTNFPPGLFITE